MSKLKVYTGFSGARTWDAVCSSLPLSTIKVDTPDGALCIVGGIKDLNPESRAVLSSSQIYGAMIDTPGYIPAGVRNELRDTLDTETIKVASAMTSNPTLLRFLNAYAPAESTFGVHTRINGSRPYKDQLVEALLLHSSMTQTELPPLDGVQTQSMHTLTSSVFANAVTISAVSTPSSRNHLSSIVLSPGTAYRLQAQNYEQDFTFQLEFFDKEEAVVINPVLMSYRRQALQQVCDEKSTPLPSLATVISFSEIIDNAGIQ